MVFGNSSPRELIPYKILPIPKSLSIRIMSAFIISLTKFCFKKFQPLTRAHQWGFLGEHFCLSLSWAFVTKTWCINSAPWREEYCSSHLVWLLWHSDLWAIEVPTIQNWARHNSMYHSLSLRAWQQEKAGHSEEAQAPQPWGILRRTWAHQDMVAQ